MIKLYQFPAYYDIPNLSPFCVKLECYLRMNKLEYSIVPVTDPSKAPKGKCPYIDDAGTVIADSELIMDYLQEKYALSIDSHLTENQLALSRTVQAMLDERLYWSVVYSRWIEESAKEILVGLFFSHLPAPIRKLIAMLAFKKVKGQLHQQGMGRHSAEDIYAIGCKDIAALSVLLADQAYFHGEQVSRIDAAVFSYTVNLLIPPFNNPLKTEAEKHENLKHHCQRMLAAYFPELPGYSSR